MARKNESVLNLLVECPWWLSVLVSGIAFVFLRYILPSIDFGSMTANAFAKGISGAAPFVAFVLLLPAPISAYKSWRKKRLLDSQQIQDFDLFFIPKPFGNSTSWQAVLGFKFRGKSLPLMVSIYFLKFTVLSTPEYMRKTPPNPVLFSSTEYSFFYVFSPSRCKFLSLSLFLDFLSNNMHTGRYET